MKQLILSIFLATFTLFSYASTALTKDTVAVIGTGNVGGALGVRLAAVGYKVVYGSRNPESDKVKALLAKTGHDATAAGQKEAAQQADIIITAVRWPIMETLIPSLGNLDGKIIVDPAYPPSGFAEDGYYESRTETSSAEMIQAMAPGAMVVKAFVTIGAYALNDPSIAGGLISVPIAADDRAAKEKVAAMAYAIGFDPVDVGPLRFARNIEALAMMWMTPHLQQRAEGFEFYFRRSNYFPCNPYRKADGKVYIMPPVSDSEDLAVMPHPDGAPVPCP
jgi:NADPH-dependent F420 reductase